MKHKSIQFDQEELLYLLMLTEDEFEDLKESLQESTNLSVAERATLSFHLSFAERLSRRFRDALREVDPVLLYRYEKNQ